MNKFKVLPVDKACECPFYLQQSSGNNACFVKSIVSPGLIPHLFDGEQDVKFDNWEDDCHGKYENCCIVSSIWDMDELNQDQEKPNKKPKSKPSNSLKNTAKEDTNSKEELKKEEVIENDEESNFVNISIHKVSNPFRVKADALIYPTNSLLGVDNFELHQMSRGMIQQECDLITEKISPKMGHVYRTSNGGDGSKVVPKNILHAVVCGPSRLVNESDIKTSVKKGLILAEELKASSVVILPADCGTFDVETTARVQLVAINLFLNNCKTQHIKNIFIVMEDDTTVKIFEEYFERIFNI